MLFGWAIGVVVWYVGYTAAIAIISHPSIDEPILHYKRFVGGLTAPVSAFRIKRIEPEETEMQRIYEDYIRLSRDYSIAETFVKKEDW